jgi:probable HAF family extracellular repeat protein
MNASKMIFVLLILALPGLIASKPAAAQADYQFTVIDARGSSVTNVYGISNNGLVSGTYLDAKGFNHGFIICNFQSNGHGSGQYLPSSFEHVNPACHGSALQEGTLVTVDHPGSLDTLLGPANNPGVIIGNYDNTIVGSAVLYDVRAGTWHPLPDPMVFTAGFNTGNGINNAGTVTGSAFDANFNNGRGWVWDGRAYFFFSVPGATGVGGTYSSGINDRGQIVGDFEDSNGVRHGFLKEGTDLTIIDVPGARDTVLLSINAQSDIVGFYGDRSKGVRHGLILRRGRVITVDYPGAAETWITYINDAGDLAGYYQQDSTIFIQHGFIATPVHGGG